MNPNHLNLCAVLLILIIITGCVCRSDRDNGEIEPTSSPTSANLVEKTTPLIKDISDDDKNKKKDEGDFKVEHIAVKDPRYLDFDRKIKEKKELEKAADRLNQALILPNDITLRTKDCGEANAFYDPNDQSVTVCYELMEHFYKVFKSDGDSDQKASDYMFDTVRFAFLHEIGHALIDTYNLPITGNEEDAADRCSSFINLEELGDDGVRAVLAAADAFRIESKGSPVKTRDLSDEHLLQEQRSFNALCMTYGSDSTKHANIVNDGYLPKARAERCPSEYQRTAKSWSELLAPWRKS